MIAVVNAAFPREVKSKRLILLNHAVSDKDDEDVKFYLSEDPHWNSLDHSLSQRENIGSRGVIMVKTKTLPTLMSEFGVPYYCKMDVQGFDSVLLATMLSREERPTFISVEAECDAKTENQLLENLERLHELGYRKFKLVDQATLHVLKPEEKFYRGETGKASRRIDLWLRKLHTKLMPGTRFYGKSTSGPISLLRGLGRLEFNRRILSIKLGYYFPIGSSGPFGDDLGSDWLDFQVAREMAPRHRRDYYEAVSSGWDSPSGGFWCDWHAKFE
jgi:FkbM family methyltransferase